MAYPVLFLLESNQSKDNSLWKVNYVKVLEIQEPRIERQQHCRAAQIQRGYRWRALNIKGKLLTVRKKKSLLFTCISVYWVMVKASYRVAACDQGLPERDQKQIDLISSPVQRPREKDEGKTEVPVFEVSVAMQR
jgi:hypothetical protein